MDYDYLYVIFTYILGIFLSGLSVLFDFPLGIFSWTARFSETQQLRIFLKHSQSIISLPYSPCRNFRRFWCNGKSPICPRVLHRITSDLYLSCLGCNSIFFLSDQHFSCFPAAPGAHVTAAGQDLPHGVAERVGWLWKTTQRTSVYKGEVLYTFHMC